VRTIVRAALALALVAAVFVFALPQIAGYGAVGSRLAAISPGFAAGLAGAVVLNLLTFPLPWRVLLPRLSFVAALGFTQASTALVTVLPGGAPLGMALSFGLLRRLGQEGAAAGFAVAVTGVWSQISIFLFPLAGVAATLATGALPPAVAVAAAASAALAALTAAGAAAALRSRSGTRRLGDAARHAAGWFALRTRRAEPGWDGESLARLRDDGVRLLRRRWAALTAATLANQLTGYLLLEVSLRATGISSAQLSPAQTFMAWSLGRLIGSLPLTPGGLGVVELGLVGTLVAFGGPRAHVVAAVLLYRAVIVLPTLLLGLGTLLVWRLRPQAPA
jgi:uncharacterized membrane protein YbhN (UPF0104 family)